MICEDRPRFVHDLRGSTFDTRRIIVRPLSCRRWWRWWRPRRRRRSSHQRLRCSLRRPDVVAQRRPKPMVIKWRLSRVRTRPRCQIPHKWQLRVVSRPVPDAAFEFSRWRAHRGPRPQEVLRWRGQRGPRLQQVLRWRAHRGPRMQSLLLSRSPNCVWK